MAQRRCSGFQQRAALQLTCQSPAIPEILVQPLCQQRQRIAVPQLRGCGKAFVERAANNPVVVYQRQRFVRDNFFELILGRSGPAMYAARASAET
jgi:hypothetical protein